MEANTNLLKLKQNFDTKFPKLSSMFFEGTKVGDKDKVLEDNYEQGTFH